jgi:hypothetical protein
MSCCSVDLLKVKGIQGQVRDNSGYVSVESLLRRAVFRIYEVMVKPTDYGLISIQI